MFSIPSDTKTKILKRFPHLAKVTDKQIAHAVLLTTCDGLSVAEISHLSTHLRPKGPVPGSGRYAGGNTQGAPLLGVRLEPELKARLKAVGGSAWVRRLIIDHIEEAELGNT